MRKYHRWLSFLFGAFLLWIAATGLTLQILPDGDEHDHDRPAAAVPAPGQAGVPAGFVCPATMNCRPKPKAGAEGGGLKDFVMHLHSGEAIGFPGKVISVLSAMALLFFAFSGLWMYIQMWRARNARGLRPRWWWK